MPSSGRQSIGSSVPAGAAADAVGALVGPHDRRLWAALLLLGLALLVLRNVPWHLEDNDEAKQAYAALEMAETGELWFVHTPRGAIATKPPLLGWLSVLTYRVSGDWDVALRLPGLLAALAVAAALWRLGNGFAAWGGGIAVVAFVFNMLTPRIATLARTDMLLTAAVFGAGALVFLRLRDGTDWTPARRLVLGGLLGVGLFAKGPVILAFLLPGAAALAVLGRIRGFRVDLGGGLPWLLPLVLFGAWVVGGLVSVEGFYREIVVAEFASRFDAGADALHEPKPVTFYLLPLLHRFGPWSLLLLALAAAGPVRRRVARDPALLWLVCWAAGGLLLMSLVPAKRLDRVFPAVPPLCLLLPGMLAPALSQPRAEGWLRTARVVLAAGVLLWSSYTVWCVFEGHWKGKAGLRRFAADCLAAADVRDGAIAVVGGHEEGLLFYARQLHLLPPEDLPWRFRRGDWPAAIVQARLLREAAPEMGRFVELAASPPGFVSYACVAPDPPGARARSASGPTSGRSRAATTRSW